MSRKSDNPKPSSERIMKDIRRRTANSIPPRRKSASCRTPWLANTALRGYADAKASPTAFIPHSPDDARFPWYEHND